MPKDLNEIKLLGTVGRDPELTYTKTGKALCVISLATDHSWKDTETGKIKKATTWHKVVAWGKAAETMAENLKKGSRLFITGRLTIKDYVARDGGKKQAAEILVLDSIFLSPSAKRGVAPPSPADETDEDWQADEEVPF